MLRLVSVAFALTSLACVVPLQRADAATFDFATLAQTPGAQGGGEGFWANQSRRRVTSIRLAESA
jgi:hypothetical protein